MFNFSSYVKENFFSAPKLGRLPRRVQVRLRERERANEIFVRIIQLGIVLMFATLYSFATKTGTDQAFQPVPYVLGAYLAFSIIGLIWAVKTELPDWSVYGSILLDFLLLYSLIVSFHIQYEQPASFVLKAPTLLYVFIFIALRALRLEWKFVVAAGAVAAVGWLLVINYVINIEPEDTMITRSYVQYLTSNSILVGAEIDKIISILSVTGILAIVVNGSSNLLVSSVSEHAAAEDLSRFFDDSVAQDIRSSSEVLQAGQGERRTTAIINIDLRGFSNLATGREPSEVMQILSRYQGRVLPILKAHGAIIDKFMGDGIMATLGLNDPSMAFSRASVEVVEALMEDLKKWDDEEPLLKAAGANQIGIGIAAGEVSFGAVGQGNRLEMTVIGAPVNTSAKFEKHNKVLNSLCTMSRAVWDQAVSEGYSGLLKPVLMEAEIEGLLEKQKIAIISVAQLEKIDVSQNAQRSV